MNGTISLTGNLAVMRLLTGSLHVDPLGANITAIIVCSLLNFGARRLRASRLAGKTEIPAFVDVLATSYDQVIENVLRGGVSWC